MTTTLTAALAAVEAAWAEWPAYDPDQDEKHAMLLRYEVSALYHALRAVRESGAVVAVVSREAVEALETFTRQGAIHAAGEQYERHGRDAAQLLARDLAAVLKETP